MRSDKYSEAPWPQRKKNHYKDPQTEKQKRTKWRQPINLRIDKNRFEFGVWNKFQGSFSLLWKLK